MVKQTEIEDLLNELPQKRENSQQALAQHSGRGSKTSKARKESSSSATKRGVGRPRKSSQEKAKKHAGNHYRKKRHDDIIAEYDRKQLENPSVVAVPVMHVPELDEYERRLKHGVMQQMKATVETEQNEWMRT